jgi:predicted enzyme related to lactoylglutathione lyase
MTMPDQSTTRVGVVLAAADVATLTDFYVDRLGFTLEASFNDPPYVILIRNGTRLSLAEQGHEASDLPSHVMTVPAERARPSMMLVLEVDDCDATRAQLENAGVTFLSDTFRPPWGGARCFLADPEGNVIELEQLP